MKLQPPKKKRGEGITHVSKLFEKYMKTIKAPQGTVVKEFVDLVDDLCQIKIKPEQCTYSVATKTMKLTVSGMVKTEILLRKKEVLAHMKGRLGEKGAPTEIL